jgi:hypothetical protein
MEGWSVQAGGGSASAGRELQPKGQPWPSTTGLCFWPSNRVSSGSDRGCITASVAFRPLPQPQNNRRSRLFYHLEVGIYTTIWHLHIYAHGEWRGYITKRIQFWLLSQTV